MARESMVDFSKKQGKGCCDTRLNNSENTDSQQNYTKSDGTQHYETEQNNNQNNDTQHYDTQNTTAL